MTDEELLFFAGCPEALALYEKSMAIRERLVNEQDTPGNRQSLSVSYNKVADILKKRGRLDKALALYEKAMAIREQLAQERGTVDDQDGLAVAYAKMAVTIEDPEKQISYAKRGLEISKMLQDTTGSVRHQTFYRTFMELLESLKK